MKRRVPPTSLQVIAIVCIVVGALGLIGFLMQASWFLQLFGQKPGPNRIVEFLEQQRPEYPLVQQLLYWSDLVFSVLFIVIGTGLIAWQRWSMPAGMLLALLDLTRRVAGGVYALGWLYPVYRAYCQQELLVVRGQEAKRIISSIETGFLLWVAIRSLFILFPVALLLILRQPAVRAFFRGRQLDNAAEAVYVSRSPGPSERET